MQVRSQCCQPLRIYPLISRHAESLRRQINLKRICGVLRGYKLFTLSLRKSRAHVKRLTELAREQIYIEFTGIYQGECRRHRLAELVSFLGAVIGSLCCRKREQTNYTSNAKVSIIIDKII